MSGLDCFRLRLRNDAARISVIANPQGEAIQKADNEAERIYVIVNPQDEAIQVVIIVMFIF
jgi:hypothetical protein